MAAVFKKRKVSEDEVIKFENVGNDWKDLLISGKT